MIYDNLVVSEEAERLNAEARSKLQQENDNVVFGFGILSVIMEEIKKYPCNNLGSSIVMASTCTRTRWRSPPCSKLSAGGWVPPTSGSP